MGETLQTLQEQTSKQKAIEALWLVQKLDFPISRDEFPAFLYESEVTNLFKALVEKFGAKREGYENLNYLIYPSIVRGKLVPGPYRKEVFFFAALYIPERQELPNKIGLYRKHGQEPQLSYGLELPIDPTGNFDIKRWRGSNYAGSTRQAIRVIKSASAETQVAIELTAEDAASLKQPMPIAA
jgi:hypothetical protein